MKKAFLFYASVIVVFSFLIQSCDSKYSKKDHLNTIKIDDNLFIEIYKITSGGVLASDTYSDYLTDSTNFRKYVGTVYYDDEKNYWKVIDSNTVLIYRLNFRNKSDTLEQKVYIISDLIKEGSFD